MAAQKDDTASCVKVEHKTPLYASSVFVALKRLDSVGWVLKIMSTSRDIVLEVEQLWLPHLQKLPVCLVRKVVLKSHPMESQHTSRKHIHTVQIA